jgi:hypothetical protein
MYFPAADFLDAQLGTSPSQVWRTLVEGRDVRHRRRMAATYAIHWSTRPVQQNKTTSYFIYVAQISIQVEHP